MDWSQDGGLLFGKNLCKGIEHGLRRFPVRRGSFFFSVCTIKYDNEGYVSIRFPGTDMIHIPYFFCAFQEKSTVSDLVLLLAFWILYLADHRNRRQESYIPIDKSKRERYTLQ